ncbi:MAG TPA: hypothetical protein VKQ54_07110 [Caulobacteraceae bacterium]|nr:hypothetical protein [Caulobacteraceae bacterium]
MIPRGARGVDHLATRMITGLMPKAADAYMGADIGLLAALVRLVAQDFDRAAQVLTTDIEAAAGIFRTAAPLIADEDLRRRMAEAAALCPTSLRIEALNAQADVATRVLIDLHAAVEAAADDGAAWAPALDATIWGFLDDYVAKRAYDSAF